MADPAIDGKEKGMVVKEIAEKGRFHGHVVSLLRMLINKNKVEMVREVLEEFGRIYEELSGTRVVLVSSRGRLQEDELLGIAKRVQRLSGAAKVKGCQGEEERLTGGRSCSLAMAAGEDRR